MLFVYFLIKIQNFMLLKTGINRRNKKSISLNEGRKTQSLLNIFCLELDV